jgi:hypothetical protein
MEHFSPAASALTIESDCPTEEKAEKRSNCKLVYDEHGIGRFVRRD